MTKRMVIMLILVLLVVAGIAGIKYMGFKKQMGQMTAMMSALPVVSASEAKFDVWQAHTQAVGSLRAAKGVDIANELAGIVEEIDFHSGSDVKAGALLVKQRAEDDIAKLKALEATAKLADITYKRDQKQLKVEAVSQAVVDNDKANLDNARALAAQQKALVDKKFIRAPFSGHLGIRNIDLGQYINAGTAIVTLQELDPIYVDFTMPQQALAQVKQGQKVTAKNDTYPDRSFIGTIAAISPKVDPATRNIQVRAAIKNPDHALLPGMYSTVEITVGKPEQYITLPQTAITYNPYGNTVFVLKESDDNGQKKLSAEQTFVTLGETRGDQVAVIKGVKEGDLVVTGGQLKLQNGQAVKVDNKVMPTSNASPSPADE